MKALIEEIQEALKVGSVDTLAHTLAKNSHYLWERDYPIAVVHTNERIKEEKIVSFFEREKLLDSEGFTPTVYTKEQLDVIAQNAPAYLQCASVMALEKPTPYPQAFKDKFPKDYWKKLQDVEHIKAVIEIASFNDTDSKCSVEFSLREVMRKRKEVNVLKKVGYVWIAAIPKAIMIEQVMAHYFLENSTVVYKEDMAYYIGWNETLKGINMRYFVCPPA